MKLRIPKIKKEYFKFKPISIFDFTKDKAKFLKEWNQPWEVYIHEIKNP